MAREDPKRINYLHHLRMLKDPVLRGEIEHKGDVSSREGGRHTTRTHESATNRNQGQFTTKTQDAQLFARIHEEPQTKNKRQQSTKTLTIEQVDESQVSTQGLPKTRNAELERDFSARSLKPVIHKYQSQIHKLPTEPTDQVQTMKNSISNRRSIDPISVEDSDFYTLSDNVASTSKQLNSNLKLQNKINGARTDANEGKLLDSLQTSADQSAIHSSLPQSISSRSKSKSTSNYFENYQLQNKLFQEDLNVNESQRPTSLLPTQANTKQTLQQRQRQLTDVFEIDSKQEFSPRENPPKKLSQKLSTFKSGITLWSPILTTQKKDKQTSKYKRADKHIIEVIQAKSSEYESDFNSPLQVSDTGTSRAGEIADKLDLKLHDLGRDLDILLERAKHVKQQANHGVYAQSVPSQNLSRQLKKIDYMSDEPQKKHLPPLHNSHRQLPYKNSNLMDSKVDWKNGRSNRNIQYLFKQQPAYKQQQLDSDSSVEVQLEKSKQIRPVSRYSYNSDQKIPYNETGKNYSQSEYQIKSQIKPLNLSLDVRNGQRVEPIPMAQVNIQRPRQLEKIKILTKPTNPQLKLVQLSSQTEMDDDGNQVQITYLMPEQFIPVQVATPEIKTPTKTKQDEHDFKDKRFNDCRFCLESRRDKECFWSPIRQQCTCNLCMQPCNCNLCRPYPTHSAPQFSNPNQQIQQMMYSSPLAYAQYQSPPMYMPYMQPMNQMPLQEQPKPQKKKESSSSEKSKKKKKKEKKKKEKIKVQVKKKIVMDPPSTNFHEEGHLLVIPDPGKPQKEEASLSQELVPSFESEPQPLKVPNIAMKELPEYDLANVQIPPIPKIQGETSKYTPTLEDVMEEQKIIQEYERPTFRSISPIQPIMEEMKETDESSAEEKHAMPNIIIKDNDNDQNGNQLETSSGRSSNKKNSKFLITQVITNRKIVMESTDSEDSDNNQPNQSRAMGLPPVDFLLAHLENVKRVQEKLKLETSRLESSSFIDDPLRRSSQRSQQTELESSSKFPPQFKVINVDSTNTQNEIKGNKFKLQNKVNYDSDDHRELQVQFDRSNHNCTQSPENPSSCTVCGNLILTDGESDNESASRNKPKLGFQDIKSLNRQDDPQKNKIFQTNSPDTTPRNEIQQKETPVFTKKSDSNKKGINIRITSKSSPEKEKRDNFKSPRKNFQKQGSQASISSIGGYFGDKDRNTVESQADSEQMPIKNLMEELDQQSPALRFSGAEKGEKEKGRFTMQLADIGSKPSAVSRTSKPSPKKPRNKRANMSHVVDMKGSQNDDSHGERTKSLLHMLSQAGDDAVAIEEEEYEEEMEEESKTSSDKKSKISFKDTIAMMMKHQIMRSAKEIIPPEYSHLFKSNKKDNISNKSKFKAQKQKKQKIIRTKIYKLGSMDELNSSATVISLQTEDGQDFTEAVKQKISRSASIEYKGNEQKFNPAIQIPIFERDDEYLESSCRPSIDNARAQAEISVQSPQVSTTKS